MDQWLKLWKSLSIRQRATIGVIVAALAGGFYLFTGWQHERDFKLLFSGVEAEDASAIVQKLKELNVEYRLSADGASVLVPSARIAEVRLQLAGAGLPKSGRIGFELFDRTNLGTTDFAEHINFVRALEGELERSIRSLSEVDQARVHLTFAKDSVFVEQRLPAKASVLLKLKTGAKIAPSNVLAICHLVASAVEGLAAESVAVVDMRGNLLSKPRRNDPAAEASEHLLEYSQKLERDLSNKVSATLTPLLGSNKYQASVAVECDLTTAEESQETYDPEKTVMLSTQTSEESSGAALTAGVPGTGSNLPRPVSKPSGSSGALGRRTESVSYQPSKLVRHIRTPQGQLKRVSVAVLVDYNVERGGKNGKERKLVPPTPESLKTIRELVAASIGFVEERGDQIVVETLPFEATKSAEPDTFGTTPAAPVASTAIRIDDPKTLAIGGACGAALLIAVLLLPRIFRKKQKKTVVVSASRELAAASSDDAEHRHIPDAKDEIQKQIREQADQKKLSLVEAQRSLKLKNVTTPKSEVLASYLRESVKTDPTSAASVIKAWLHEE